MHQAIVIQVRKVVFLGISYRGGDAAVAVVAAFITFAVCAG